MNKDIMERITQNLAQGMCLQGEQPEDIISIRQVNRVAFGGEYEAKVIDRLRQNCPDILSLVVKDGEDVVGHILFSPAQIVKDGGGHISGMGLGPLAVHPDYQGLGIGSALCKVGLQRIKKNGYPFVVVLGHPGYYPRFGFERASAYGIKTAFQDVPDEAFMICIFDNVSSRDLKGIAYYRPEFDEES